MTRPGDCVICGVGLPQHDPRCSVVTNLQRPYERTELSHILDMLESQYDKGDPLDPLQVFEVCTRLQTSNEALQRATNRQAIDPGHLAEFLRYAEWGILKGPNNSEALWISLAEVLQQLLANKGWYIVR